MLAFEAVSLINWLVKSLRSAMFPGCPSLATGLWPPCQGSEQPAGLFLCYSSSEVGFVEWEVQSSWTGCGAPPPTTTTTTELACSSLSAHVETTKFHFGIWKTRHLRLSPWFTSASRPNPGESAGMSLFHFYLACVSHHYRSFVHGSLCDFSVCCCLSFP